MRGRACEKQKLGEEDRAPEPQTTCHRNSAAKCRVKTTSQRYPKLGMLSPALDRPPPHSVPGQAAPEVHRLDLEVEGNPEGVA